jgi:suppressor for copper-sensitivity B
MKIKGKRMFWRFLGVAWLCALTAAVPVSAQSDVATGFDVFPNLSLGDLGNPPAADSKEPASFSAEYTADSDTGGTVTVTAKLGSAWHLYSVTQAAGGPTPTKIRVTGPAGVELAGKFTPSSPPEVTTSDAWPGLKVEEHYGEISWRAPVRWPAGFSGDIELSVSALACMTDGSCVPQNPKLTAKRTAAGSALAVALAAPAEAAAEPKTVLEEIDAAEGETVFRDARSVVEWSGRIIPATAKPGSRATLQFTAKPDATYHVYAAAVDDTESRTNFVVKEKGGLKLGTPQPPSAPIIKELLPGVPAAHYHEGAVTWSIPIEIPADAEPGSKSIQGLIAYQACTDTSCLQPKAIRFTARLDVAAAAGDASVAQAVRFATAPLGATMDAAAETKWVDELAAAPAGPAGDSGASGQGAGGEEAGGSQVVAAEAPVARPSAAGVPLSLALILLMAVGGGLILNLMPCVLPVVGLKIMSFASQAGQDRGKVLALNLAYTLGILAVFWALAALAILSTYSWGQQWLGVEGQVSWGQQFQFFGFRFPVTLFVFALALSFLGVWEIPLPGFVGGKSTQGLQKKEGFAGAFFKGIFTTVLATPCSGPLLGAVFAYTLGKSALVIFAIFTAIGFGMALPYLLIALFPPLIAFLPKPGDWMDILKQLLGFLLLATVVFLFSFFPDEERVPVFMSLIGVWFGCWLIGLVPNWHELSKRLMAWGSGLTAAAAVCYLAFSFGSSGNSANEVVSWEPYNEARLTELRNQGRTVLIDFTAKWCLTCQVNYKVALNTQPTGELVDELGAVAMLADWTNHNEEIRKKLQELDSNSIPVLAIYPGKDPEKPIVLRDLVSQGDVLEALRQAGPSVATDAVANGSVDGTKLVGRTAETASR